ncbi:TRM11 methyltransferase, partial [Amia calva]|nr:TRM11 methyltransferase [Amia calva]
QSPFWVLNSVSEEGIRRVMKRTVCAKSVFELWGFGRTPQELQSSLKNWPVENMVPYLTRDSTYKINIYTFNKTLLHQQRIQKIDALEFLPFQGKVNLKNPDHVFCLLEDYGSDPNCIPDEPFRIFFGRWVADGQRDLIKSHSVKKRHFIGNTSMDAGLSFIMANHARVKPNDLVYDPFVGTGSLLVACAHFGSYVCGTDIDYNTIHGIGKASRKNQKWRGPDENIRANLRQYGAEKSYIDVLVSDASKTIWRAGAVFDAIITDRRLVYWLPVYRPEYKEEIIPQHPCLKLISNCEQTLSSHTSRRLITMEKLKEFEVSVYAVPLTFFFSLLCEFLCVCMRGLAYAFVGVCVYSFCMILCAYTHSSTKFVPCHRTIKRFSAQGPRTMTSVCG